MKRALMLHLLSFSVLAGILSAQQAVMVADGTALHVRLKEELSSQKVHRGDLVEFEVAEPLLVNGATVVEKGAIATARIADGKSAGHFSRNGRLAWAMDSVPAVGGVHLPLRFIKEVPQGGAGAKTPSKAAKAAEAAALSPVLLYYSPAIVVAIPFAAAKKGKPEIIPAGERYLVFVNGEVVLPAN